MTRLAILFDRLGPYHHARLAAAGRLGPLTAIEFSGEDRTYAWAKVPGADGFTRITLFPNEEAKAQSIARIGKRLEDCWQDIRPDVVAIAGWGSTEMQLALQYALRAGTRVVLMSASTRMDEVRVSYKEWVKGRIVKLFSSAIVGGTPHAEYVARLGMPADRIYPGYDVVDNRYFIDRAVNVRDVGEDRRVRLGLPERFFLTSNRFIFKKNLPRLLEAYARYRKMAGEKAWSLVMLGDGELRGELERLRARLGLQQSVLMPGFKQYEELPDYYGLAGAFVHASTAEQWGLVINEAMAAGLPIILSKRCGCASDLIEEGRNGWTFDPLDVEGLAHLMLKLASLPESEREAMGRASQEIIGRWTPEVFAQNLWRAAELAVQAPRPRASLIDRALLWTLIHR